MSLFHCFRQGVKTTYPYALSLQATCSVVTSLERATRERREFDLAGPDLAPESRSLGKLLGHRSAGSKNRRFAAIHLRASATWIADRILHASHGTLALVAVQAGNSSLLTLDHFLG